MAGMTLLAAGIYYWCCHEQIEQKTMKTPLQNPAPSLTEPAWEVAYLFPSQGSWSEEEYLALKGNRLVEFSHGFIEVLPMPTTAHQLIVGFLYRVIQDFVAARGLGTLVFAPLRVRLWPGKFREPDLAFLFSQHRDRMGNEFWEGADLVMEVVSDDDRRRDLETKRREYAQARIPEYWIVDPQDRRISVLKLSGDRYAEHGVFGTGSRAGSLLLAGLEVEVASVFAASAEAEAGK
jgi:Uma2 family endonuclease